MAKALFVTIAVLAASLDSGNVALAKANGDAVSSEDELLIHRRKLGKSGKGAKGGMYYPPPVHPDLHHHGYHPHHLGKSGKGMGKSAKYYIDGGLGGWAGSDGHDDDPSVSSDDGYEWVGSGGVDDDGNTTSADVMEGDHDASEDEGQWWSGGVSSAEDDADDDGHWWTGVEYPGKSGKGSKSHKSAKVGKSGKGYKSGKSYAIAEHWGGWGSWPVTESTMPSPVPTPCGKGGKECPEKPDWNPEVPTPVPTPCGKAGKECPPPVPAPGPKPGPQTLPPICNTIPCSINGVPVSPTIPTAPMTPETTLPPICNIIPCSINGVNVSPPMPTAPMAPTTPAGTSNARPGAPPATTSSTIGTVTTEPPVPESIGSVLTTNPPVSVDMIISPSPDGASYMPTATDVIGVPPPTPPAMPQVPAPPSPLVPITVAPSSPSESKYPTWEPTFVPTTTIQTLTTSGNWFQTGKAYEVDSYTRARMGDQNDAVPYFAKQEVISGSRRSLPRLASSVAMAILMFQLVW